jgi:WD40 repeat protein
MIIRCRLCGAQQSRMPGAYCISCREPLELVPDESAAPAAAAGGTRSPYLAPLLIGGACLAIAGVVFLAQRKSPPPVPAISAAAGAPAAPASPVRIASHRLIDHPAQNNGGDVYTLAFSPDGKQLVSGGQNQDLILWDVATGEAVRRFVGHAAEIHSVAFSPDGRRIVSGGEFGHVRLWNAVDGTGVEFSARSPPEQSVVSKLRLATTIKFSPDGKQFLVCGQGSTQLGSDSNPESDHQVWTWNLDDVNRPTIFRAGENTSHVTALFLPGGKELISADRAGRVYVWDIADGTRKRQVACDGEVYRIAVGPEPASVLLATDNGLLSWNPETDEKPRRVDDKRDKVRRIHALSHDKKIALTGIFNEKSRTTDYDVWDVASGHVTAVLEGPEIYGMAWEFSPDDSLVAVAYTGEIRIWKLPAK